MPDAPRTARALARRELTRAILEEARRQLAEVGPAALSVRAVARELGMASSAVYRYFATRDELLTALIVICYDELGAAAEAAEGAIERADLAGRWRALTAAFRDWAKEHPYDYALLYGSPVPGYAAPADTVEPAARVVRLVVQLVSDAGDPGDVPSAEAAAALTNDIRAFFAPRLTDDQCYRALAAWGGVLGAVTLELFGHLHNAIADYDAWFAESMCRIAPIRVDHPASDALRSEP